MARVKFRYQKSYARVYRVGQSGECTFTSVQAAIDQAVLDGYTSSANPCVVEIYEKGSPYVEDLVLNSGVNLTGVVGQNRGKIAISGSADYAPTTGSRTLNRITIANIDFISAGAGVAPTYHIGGTAGFQTFFYNCGFVNDTSDGQSVFVKDGPQPAGGSGDAQGRILFFNTGIYLFDSVNTINAVEILGGRLNVFGNDSEFLSEGDLGDSCLYFDNGTRFTMKQDSSGFAGISGDCSKLISCPNGGVQLTISRVTMQNYTSDPAGNIISCLGSQDFSLNHCDIQGANGFAFDLDNSVTARINHCTIRGPGPLVSAQNNSLFEMKNSSYECFNAADMCVGNTNSNIRLFNCVVENNNPGSHLIVSNGAETYELSNCTIFTSDSYLINSLANGGDVTIQHCFMKLAGTSGLAEGPGIMTIFWGYNSTGSTSSGSWAGLSQFGPTETPNNITILVVAEGARYDFNNNKITCYVGFSNGFPSIQSACDFLTTVIPSDPTILLNGNSDYVEDVTWPVNIRLHVQGENPGSVSQVLFSPTVTTTITGNHTMDTTGAPGAPTISFQNVQFKKSNTASPTITTSGPLELQMNFVNCSISNNDVFVSEASDFLDCQSPVRLSLTDCWTLVDVDDGFNFIRLSSQSTVIANTCVFNSTYGSIAKQNLFVNVDFNSTIITKNCHFRGVTTRLLDLISGYVAMYYNIIEVDSSGGEIFYYSGNMPVLILDCYVDPSPSPGSLIARDGIQAEDEIQLTGNIYAPGDGYAINGVNFVEGAQFIAGVDEAATAIAIANAVNASVNVLIQNVIYAEAVGNNVELFAYRGGVIGNAYTLALIGTAPATITGAVFAGGVNGSGGSLTYGGGSFGNNKIAPTINFYQTALNPVAI